MEAEARRRVKSVDEYLHLFSRPTGNDIVIKKSADVNDTVKFIQEKVPQVAWQVKKFSKFIKGNNKEETCRNIWQWLYDHIPYKKDEEGVEQIRSPRRLVYEGSKSGVDCDCYSFTISCCLTILKIAHKFRVTKYLRKDGEAPRWQHIYIVVPRDGNLDYDLNERRDYIVIDCVKDRYDDEEPYLEFKDYDMRLDFLDGIEDERMRYETPASVDAQALASALDEDELGKLKIGQALKKVVKKVGNAAGKVIRKINKVANPATILIRNSFLLAMKVNLFNIAKRVRYAYLSDQQAASMKMNLAELAKLRKIKDKAETIYWQVGGKKENLKKAILNGKGNKDKKVPLSGLSGLDDDVYADMDEYNIIHGLGELGVAPAAGGMAAAMPFLTAIVKALKEIKNLFPKGSSGDAEMATEADTEAANMNFSESQIMAEDTTPAPVVIPQQIQQSSSGSSSTQMIQNNASTTTPATTDTEEETTTDKGTQTGTDQGFFQKAGTWIKENPGKSAIIGVGVLAGAFLLTRPKTVVNVRGGLQGFPKKKKQTNKPKNKKTKPKKNKISKVNAIKIR